MIGRWGLILNSIGTIALIISSPVIRFDKELKAFTIKDKSEIGFQVLWYGGLMCLLVGFVLQFLG